MDLGFFVMNWSLETLKEVVWACWLPYFAVDQEVGARARCSVKILDSEERKGGRQKAEDLSDWAQGEVDLETTVGGGEGSSGKMGKKRA